MINLSAASSRVFFSISEGLKRQVAGAGAEKFLLRGGAEARRAHAIQVFTRTEFSTLLQLFWARCVVAEERETMYNLRVIGVCDSLGAAILFRAQGIGIFRRLGINREVEDLSLGKPGAGGPRDKCILARGENLP